MQFMFVLKSQQLIPKVPLRYRKQNIKSASVILDFSLGIRLNLCQCLKAYMTELLGYIWICFKTVLI